MNVYPCHLFRYSCKIVLAAIIGLLIAFHGHGQSLKLLASLKKTKPEIKPLKAKGKEVYFIEMRHLAKPAFYDNVKLTVDSFIYDNYVVYFEGVGTGKKERDFNDSLILKKMRKILGVDITAEYAEFSAYKFFVKKHGLIFQPKFYDSTNSIHFKNVDLTYNDLIQSYENRHGEIILDSCDLHSNLGQANYPCNSFKKQRKVFDKEFVMKARNKRVAQTIKNSTDKKILVLYGALHYKGIKKLLRKLKRQ